MKQFLGKTEKWCHTSKAPILSQKKRFHWKLLSLEHISESTLRQEPACLAPGSTFLELLKLDDTGYTTECGNIHVLFTGHLFLTIHCSTIRLCSYADYLKPEKLLKGSELLHEVLCQIHEGKVRESPQNTAKNSLRDKEFPRASQHALAKVTAMFFKHSHLVVKQ